MRKQRVWKLPTFLLYCFSVTVAYLISFLPLFLSTRFINTDRTSLLWLRYLYISIFFWVQNFYALFILIWDPIFSFFCVCVYVRRAEPPCFGWGISISQFFFLGAKLLCSVYINMRPFFFRLFVFVFILDEHPWHAIDVFVRLPKCRFNNAIILLPKKLIYFT